MAYFLSRPLTDDIKFNDEEILEAKWIDIDKIKNMESKEFRCYKVVENIVKNLEAENFYDLDMFVNLSKA